MDKGIKLITVICGLMAVALITLFAIPNNREYEEYNKNKSNHVKVNDSIDAIYKLDDMSDITLVSDKMAKEGLKGDILELSIGETSLLSDFVSSYDVDKYWLLMDGETCYEIVKVDDEIHYQLLEE